MSTIYKGIGYKLRPHYWLKDSTSIKPSTKAIFNILQANDILKEFARRIFSSKLALPIIETVDDYNYNMNGVDRADQLRAEFKVNQVTSRS